jgi:hypothetical protein
VPMFLHRAAILAPSLALVVLASACSTAPEPEAIARPSVTTTSLAPVPDAEWVSVQYRNGPVDVASFDHMAGSGSLVDGAWYDDDTGYLIVDLGAKSYHYCDVPASAWSGFVTATSKGTFYNSTLKGSYDCRTGTVPSYTSAGDVEVSPSLDERTTTTLSPEDEAYLADLFDRSFDGPLADAARANYWLLLMNEYGDYDAPVEMTDDAEWISGLYDAIAINAAEDPYAQCDQWNRGVEVQLESEDTYLLRPEGWTREDAYYELVASVLAYSPGPQRGGPAIEMLAECYEPGEAPESVQYMLSLAPIRYEDQNSLYKTLAEELFGDETVDTSMRWETASIADSIAEDSESCEEWWERTPKQGHMFGSTFAPSAISLSIGAGRMVFHLCGQ